MELTGMSVTTDTVIRNEANQVIAALNHSNYPIDPIVAESVLESLMAIAEKLDLAVAKTLHVRLVAIRNNIHVNQIQQVA